MTHCCQNSNRAVKLLLLLLHYPEFYYTLLSGHQCLVKSSESKGKNHLLLFFLSVLPNFNLSHLLETLRVTDEFTKAGGMHTISYLYKLCPRCSALFAAWSVASFFALLASPRSLSFSLSLFILVWQMNLGQKLWKLKWVPPVEGDHCTNLNFRAMMKPKKKREKKKQPRSCHKTFRTSPLLVAKVEATKGQRWRCGGEGKRAATDSQRTHSTGHLNCSFISVSASTCRICHT